MLQLALDLCEAFANENQSFPSAKGGIMPTEPIRALNMGTTGVSVTFNLLYLALILLVRRNLVQESGDIPRFVAVLVMVR